MIDTDHSNADELTDLDCLEIVSVVSSWIIQDLISVFFGAYHAIVL